MTLKIHEILLENQTKQNFSVCECPQERDQTPEREKQVSLVSSTWLRPPRAGSEISAAQRQEVREPWAGL